MWGLLCVVLVCLLALTLNVQSQSSSGDAAVMQVLKKNLNSPSNLGWSDSDPRKWDGVNCDGDRRVARIQIEENNLKGSLLSNLTNLFHLGDIKQMKTHLLIDHQFLNLGMTILPLAIGNKKKL
ncbi:hypothetical protein PVL29_024237 [Vitis rotundifolia]|uniref:Leucine-rich repeat-containing N-terminal plant-type domain-containing protein n=1 Tax=Vitis rotundifolia TaxID=103349 RepID=A0AA38YRI0_VITRO|nr:hypothetical protein PVL29_024237 [Vitis rotundifolia]